MKSLQVEVIHKISYQESRHRGIIQARVISGDEVYKGQLVKIFGPMQGCPTVGESLTVESVKDIELDSKSHRPQLYADTIYPSKIDKHVNVQDILSSKLIKCVSPSAAAKIFKGFGEKSFSYLLKAPEVFKDVGLSDEEIKKIKREFKFVAPYLNDIAFMKKVGLSDYASELIFDKHKGACKRMLLDRPYDLTQITGIGFSTVDPIAIKLGMSENDPLRISRCVDYIVAKKLSNGDTALPLDKMIKFIGKTLRVNISLIEKHISQMVEDERFCKVKTRFGEMLIRGEEARVGRGIAEEMKRLVSKSPFTVIPKVEFSEDCFLSNEQRSGVKKAVMNKVSIITGGPGVGKTTVVKEIMDQIRFNEPNKKLLVMAAPTGKASIRMEESTGMDASTIHTLLEYHPDEGYRRNVNNPLDVDTLVIDELSMIDEDLCYNLLKAIPDHARIILVGDPDQLPSVGYGQVIRDMINSRVIPCGRLTEPQRTAKNSDIVKTAHKIINGQMPDFDNLNKDFVWIESKTDDSIITKLIDTVKKLVEVYGVNPDDIQVLTPRRGTEVGVDKLNQALKNILNTGDKSRYIERFGTRFSHGDRVLFLKNDKKLDVSNGEVGKVTYIDFKNKLLTVTTDKKSVKIEFSNLDILDLSYATTVHKSQGSEYKFTLMPFSENHVNMLYRELVYTAITRAKSRFIGIGDRNALKEGINSQIGKERSTNLDYFLVESFKNDKNLDLEQEYGLKSA